MGGGSLEVSACRDDTLTGDGDDVQGVRRLTVGGDVVTLSAGHDGLGGCTVVALGHDQRVAAWGEDCNGVGGKGDC